MRPRSKSRKRTTASSSSASAITGTPMRSESSAPSRRCALRSWSHSSSVDGDPAVALGGDLGPLAAADARQELRNRALDAGPVVRLHVQRAERLRPLVAADPLGERAERCDHEDVDRSEAEPLVQPARVGVAHEHLEADMGEARFAAPARRASASSARPMPRLRASGPDVDVRDVRGLTAAVTEHAEDEAERAPVLLSDQRDALADRHGEVLPGLVPRLAEVRLVAEFRLELLPELANEVVVGFGRGSDRHW